MTTTISGTTGIVAPAASLATPLPIASGGSGAAVTKQLAQIVTSTLNTVATGTTIIPLDDTIPQNTEGDQYLSQAITPVNAGSTLEIEVVLSFAGGGAIYNTMALFQDSGVNAIAANQLTSGGANGPGSPGVMKHYMTAGTTSPTTFKLRAGPGSAATMTINGVIGGRYYGGVQVSRITIKEYLP